ncbi:TetR family transcriptional regulator [Streptomyces subrutilus]|uniref:TetR family transcriptional regulator n=1 Tax=Streptomyces subrutilus TaxID=36818 RepID=UPI002E15267F|nr:TetR family transcriptional regulator [Streptomyces subrutilus]
MVKQERAARTRESLVRAAAEVFAEQGFVTASIAVISRRAGVSAGGLHFHFESKTALAEAVEERAAGALRQVTAAGFRASSRGRPVGERDASGAAGRGPGGGALQVLVDATHALMALLAGDVVVRAGYGLCADASRASGVDLRRQWARWVEEAVRAAAREGTLAEGVAPRDAARAVVAWTVGLEVLGSRERELIAPNALTRFWSLTLPCLAAAGILDDLLPQGSRPPTTAGPSTAAGPSTTAGPSTATGSPTAAGPSTTAGSPTAADSPMPADSPMTEGSATTVGSTTAASSPTTDGSSTTGGSSTAAAPARAAQSPESPESPESPNP